MLPASQGHGHPLSDHLPGDYAHRAWEVRQSGMARTQGPSSTWPDEPPSSISWAEDFCRSSKGHGS